ncbi:MAG: hypothetical protein FWB84_05620 [Candidatus Bathyarchaeota archaeon]|uniref:hypothetical protein n=1 Tax=Candidatus Bathycorpusculum sp. TaxID=2994959 RepID=UPI00281C895D|nr:hypothetical protein [Candidatus Termiticorpusculum sp.]MCL2257954.1 hypothetical protein [Candidatus Termiticorpusculum sp.]MCL2291714.1 hypothetical protein [Candidatus Termiticorpusculum sp.]
MSEQAKKEAMEKLSCYAFWNKTHIEAEHSDATFFVLRCGECGGGRGCGGCGR